MSNWWKLWDTLQAPLISHFISTWRDACRGHLHIVSVKNNLDDSTDFPVVSARSVGHQAPPAGTVGQNPVLLSWNVHLHSAETQKKGGTKKHGSTLCLFHCRQKCSSTTSLCHPPHSSTSTSCNTSDQCSEPGAEEQLPQVRATQRANYWTSG